VVDGGGEPICGCPLGAPQSGGGCRPASAVGPFAVARPGREPSIEQGHLEVYLELVGESGQSPRPEQRRRHAPWPRDRRLAPLASRDGAGHQHRRRGVDEETDGVRPPGSGRPPFVEPLVEAGANEQSCVGGYVSLVVARAEAAALVGDEEGKELPRDVALSDPPTGGGL